jgi:hypothetical protein
VLRAVGETETTEENIQNWTELDGDPGLMFLAEEEIAVVIFIFFSPIHVIKFSIIYFLSLFFVF